MKKISSKSTAFSKRVLPVLFVGILAIAVAIPLSAGALRSHAFFLVPPLIAAGFAFALMRKLVWDLMDEVYDGGDFLLVKNRGQEERIALSNIMNVSASVMVNPPRITLRLATRGKFGDEIAFSPMRPFTLDPFAKNKIAEDLIVRVDQARRGLLQGSRRP